MRRQQTHSLIIALALTLGACGEAPKPTARPATASGERLVVRESVTGDFKPVAATVTTKDMGEARARIGGTLTQVLVKEGDVVRKGQLVGRVQDQRLTFETSAYDAQVVAAAAEASRARAELARINTLYEKGIYAKARLEQSQASARAADGQVAAARAQRAASAELGAQGAVLAPTSGRVLRADAPAGSVVSAGQSIATITAGEPLLRLEIPEAQARALRPGDPVFLVTEDLPGIQPSGVIAQVYPAVTAGRVMADISVAGLRADLVGQRVRVRIKVGERKALTVPARFVATRFGIDFVRVLGAGGQASDVAVQITGGSAPGQVEVLSGLSPGDTILAQGPAR
ncbi:efflux RND transporter periplasmic adaptor subunit [Phenylobacterium sp. LH3H17]|uniref:efflux RND transporter periplasmic adaptor subunit n=1 Tax=Phenylobacterium sp. LH3H17 TaxID=2903901 RepID=UPI0020C9D66B|nr:efflux RND transporter periplasmic adaptor subunit [Phenylobacterium sp. LH3H17]UTP41117.1 efflux RND transporter periplasmic adaptor subunit [Phenylobacterium sp. LH3H17]